MKLEDISSLVTEIPAHYRNPDCPELGDVEELLYGSTYYAGDGSPLLKPCYVYTPYGYDPDDTETRYDIFYFMHGFLCNANSTFEGDEGAIGIIFDWLIYEKKTKPFIAVALTWDFENSIRDFETSYKQILQFHLEFRQDIVPAVEAKYHTYAAGTDSKALRESRDHRAFGGYSMGAVTT
jgi:endo-1,4-beta-xylanase